MVSPVSLIVIGLAGILLLVCCAGLMIRMRLSGQGFGGIDPKQRTRRGASRSRSTKALPAAAEGRKIAELQATESANSRDDEEEERLAVDVADELHWLRKERLERVSGAQPLPAYSTVVGAAISERETE